MSEANLHLRVIGCGAMGTAIAQTLKEAGQELSVYDRHEERAESLARAIGVMKVTTPLENLARGDGILLAVKPQDFEKVAQDLHDFEGGLLVSILTGITTERLKKVFVSSTVVRMMPNLAVRYGDGVVALVDDPQLAPYKERIEKIFAPLGMVRWFAEYLFDSVTALTGSGPAFVFAIVEAMVDAAIALGFSAEVGYELVKQMLGGALTMLYESLESPAELRWQVCSPAGTTIAGIRSLEEHGMRHAILEAFLAAQTRATQLGQ